MKIAAHITFFYSSKRLEYLKSVVTGLLEIDPGIDIFIYTNRKLSLFRENTGIHIQIFSYRKFLVARFKKGSFIDRLGIKCLVHPFYLAWENRKNIERLLEKYDIQIYLEDDIKFTKHNFEYWLKYKDITIKNNYNLGFFRIEKDDNNMNLLTDVNWPLKKTIELGGQVFIVNNLNPYCGFWIYDRDELREFIQSKEWKFKFEGYGVRAKAAVGWHGKHMNRYKETIIPLTKGPMGLVTPNEATVHHLPNNYIGKGRYCTLEHPLIFN